jgi:hypothetical protein
MKKVVIKDFLVAPTLFQQVYEEITTFAYWLKGFAPHNILEVGFKGSSFHIMSQLSTGKKVAVDLEDNGRTIWSHYMMYGEDFKLFIADSQTEETKNLVRDFDPDHVFRDGPGGQVYKFWQDIPYGSKTNIVTIKSSGNITCFGEREHFGGIGLWKP